jgi:RHS repeat-associated protein
MKQAMPMSASGCRAAALVIGALLAGLAAPAAGQGKSNDKVDVALSAPASGALYAAPASVRLVAQASAKQKNHPIVKVEFFAGGALVGTVPGPNALGQYAFQWTSVPAGAYSLTARATNDKGDTDVSAPVAITVDALPAVALTSPANNAVFTAPSAIALSASAADSDGTVAKVDFYQGATLIGTATGAPYASSWTGAAPGGYVLTAKATDNLGFGATSAPVSVIVNAPPTVALASAGTSFNAPANVALAATAADSDGTVAKVDFYNGATLIGSTAAAPFNFVWSNVAAGSYLLTAVATDDRGAATRSAPVAVTVNALPTVALTSPVAGAKFNAPATILLTASAADADGAVAKVDFYQGAMLLGSAVAPPYSFAWMNVASGAYNVTAVATDDRGATTTSAAIAVLVNAPPVVSISAPGDGAIYLAPGAVSITASASDPDGTVAKVDFYQGATLIGTATQAPYSFSWTNVASGSYQITAVATDDAGAATTSSVVTVRVNAAPSISLTAPANGASFTAPANIPIAASVADTDGSIVKVEFYRGGSLIATVTAPPYSVTLTGVPQGSYVLTAVTTDDLGATVTSDPVTVTVKSGVAQVYYIFTDHLNTPRLIQDQNQKTVWRWDNTEPFGDSVPDGDPDSTGNSFDMPLRFPGTYADRETNMLYNWHRDLDPARDQYLESEPLGLAGDINLYRYARDNALSFIDPDGRVWVSVPGRSTSAGISAVIPVRGPLSISGGTGTTIHQCCSARGKVVNEWLWTVHFGVGVGTSITPSASGHGVIPLIQVGGLPQCSPPVTDTFLGSMDITVGVITGNFGFSSKILNVGLTPKSTGRSVTVNLFERTVVIDQKETGECCTPK